MRPVKRPIGSGVAIKGKLTFTRIIPGGSIHGFIKTYEYNASCESLLEILFLQKFWMWLSGFVPASIMPCTLTVSGLIINILTCLVVFCYSPDGTQLIPSWALFLCGLGMFLYQTIDALDGKQAAKLQNTHLEEFFDHGADSLSTTFITLSVGAALQLGEEPCWMLAVVLLGILTFYSTHWQAYVTDIVVFGKVDCTEGQVAIMLAHFVSAFCGQSIWKNKVPVVEMELRYVMLLVAFCFMSWIIIRNIRIILGAPTPIDDFARIPRRQGLAKYFPLIPITSWVLLLVGTYKYNNLFVASPSCFVLMFGFIFSKILIKMQIGTMGKVSGDIISKALVPVLALILINKFDVIPPSIALWATLVVTAADFLYFAGRLALDVCDLQDVWIFSLKYPVGHEKNRAGNAGIYVNPFTRAAIKARVLAEREKHQ